MKMFMMIVLNVWPIAALACPVSLAVYVGEPGCDPQHAYPAPTYYGQPVCYPPRTMYCPVPPAYYGHPYNHPLNGRYYGNNHYYGGYPRYRGGYLRYRRW